MSVIVIWVATSIIVQTKFWLALNPDKTSEENEGKNLPDYGIVIFRLLRRRTMSYP